MQRTATFGGSLLDRITPALPGLLIGFLVTRAVLGDSWFFLVALAVGVPFVAYTLLHPRAGLFIWLLLAPIAGTYGGVSLPAGIPDITFARVCVLSIGGALLFEAMLKRRRLAALVDAEVALLILLAVIAVDLAVRGTDLGEVGLTVFDEWATPVIFFMLARNLTASSDNVRKACCVLAAVGTYLAAFGMYQYLTNPGADIALGAERAIGHLGEGRAVGPFGSGAAFGGVVGLAFFCTLCVALHGASGRSRRLLLALLVPISAAVAMSMTRSVWFGFAVALAVAAWCDRARRRQFGLAIGMVVLVVIVVVAGNTTALEDRATSMSPIDERLVIYKAALAMFVDRPFTGFGRGERAFVLARRDYLTSVGGIDADIAEAGPPHNMYLFAMVQWGLAGLLPYAFALFFIVRAALRLRAAEEGRETLRYHFAGYFLACSAMFFWEGFFVDTVAFPYLTSVYFFLAGLMEAQFGEVEGREPERAALAFSTEHGDAGGRSLERLPG